MNRNTYTATQSIITEAGWEQLAVAIEANGVDCCLCWTDWAGLELGRDEHLVWMLSDIPFPFFNNVFQARIPASAVNGSIERVLERVKHKRLPMFWWTGPTTRPADLGDRLIEHGFTHAFQAPGMAMDLRELGEDVTPPDGVLIREVTNRKALEDWCRVMTPAYDFPEFAATHWLEMLDQLGLGAGRKYRHFTAYRGGRPVATSSIFLNNGVAGISSVATHPDVRGKGIGTAITVAPLRLARDLGYRYGVLFSSPMGLGVYRRIGFREYTSGDCFVWPAD